MFTRRTVLAGTGLAGLVRPPARSGKIRCAVLGIGHAHAAGKVAALSNSEDYELVGVCEPIPACRAITRLTSAFDGCLKTRF